MLYRETNSEKARYLEEEINLDFEAFDMGAERVCYVHPKESDKVIKVQRGEQYVQTWREMRFYRKYNGKQELPWTHIPKFHGKVRTSRGNGFIVDLIRDYDGEISKSIFWYLKQGYPLSDFYALLDELKEHLLKHLFVFSNDICQYNILFQKLSDEDARMVVIDGLGDHVYIDWLNSIPFLLRRKIQRRWTKLINRMIRIEKKMHSESEKYPEIKNRKHLDPAYLQKNKFLT